MTRQLTVDGGAAPRRLDVYLADALGQSRSAVANLIKAGEVTIDGEVASASSRTAPGQSIAVGTLAARIKRPAAATVELPIVYQDEDVLVIDKPAGVSAHAGNGQETGGTVADFARGYSSDPDPDRPGIVHRLDKDTSGLMVIAKNVVAKKKLQDSWQQRSVAKTYRLLVVGRLSPAEAIIDLPLDRDQAAPTRRTVAPGGRPARTRYRTLAVYPGYTYVEAYPETGRTHQLRVHFAAMGHPIAGDITYGLDKRPLGLTRQFLHAAGLKFTSPSGKAVDLESPLPPDLENVLTGLTEVAS